MSISHISGVPVNNATVIDGVGPFFRVDGILIGSSYVANTAVFASAPYIERSVALAGVSQTKTFTVSMWLNFAQAGDGVGQYMIYGPVDRFSVFKTSANLIRVVGKTSGGTTQIDMSSSLTVTSTSGSGSIKGWFHLYICVNTAADSTCKIYFNAVEDTSRTIATRSNATNMEYFASPRYIGAGNSGASRLNAAVAELWFDDAYWDVPNNFYENGRPRSLGATGATPTGSSPALYLSRDGSGNSWIGDSSTNNNDFTIVAGTIGTTNPPV